MNDLISKWGEWENCHASEDQKKRLASSKEAACTPAFIDNEKACGLFNGSRGNYETYLDHCSCTDFARRHLPCKHMYRLAIELGIINESVKAYSHGGYSWKQVVELIEKYPDNVQQAFFEHFTSSRRSSEPYRKMKRPEMDILISDGLLLEYPDKETAKYKTVHLIEDFMVDKQKVKWYFSRKFNRPTFFNGVEMEPEKLPEDEVTDFLRERGFVE